MTITRILKIIAALIGAAAIVTVLIALWHPTACFPTTALCGRLWGTVMLLGTVAAFTTIGSLEL